MVLNYRIKIGLKALFINDDYLLENNLNERTITHKLAEYYQKLFPNWNVDCEFNRNLGHIKKIIIDPKVLLSQMAAILGNSFLWRNSNLDDFSEGEIANLMNQLENPRLRYDEYSEMAYFILKLTNGITIEKTIYPDIIIHRRGTSDNYIVIEAKKTSNANNEARLFDLLKLLTLVKSPDFNYKIGIFIDFPVGTDFHQLKGFKFKPLRLDPRVHEIILEYNH